MSAPVARIRITLIWIRILLVTLMRIRNLHITLKQIGILPSTLWGCADADLDPDPTFQFDADPCGSKWATLVCSRYLTFQTEFSN
jgi:hypothetical protein